MDTALSANLLIVEDDKRLAKLLKQELEAAGHTVVVVHTGAAAVTQVREHTPELILLDLNLPDMDGIEVAEELHGQTDADIIMLTARGDVASRAEGLYAGASDYLTKPFSVKDLLSRVQAQLYERQNPTQHLSHGELSLDLGTKLCRVGEQKFPLTAVEFSLLELFLSNLGRIYSKHELEQMLYKNAELPETDTVELFIDNLKKKLSRAGLGDLIVTVQGMGYMVQ